MSKAAKGQTVGVDLGGTKILAAAVDSRGRATCHVKLVTPTDGPDAVVDAIVDAIRQVDPSGENSVGIGAPGPVSDGVLMHGPNLIGFDGPVDLAALVADRVGVEVRVGNDATVGTWGEVRHGAAKGQTHVLGCWLGTGIGGGLVLSGRVHDGATGAAGEFGHMPVQMDDPLQCGCGRWGCVEAYAGRASMAQQVEEAIARGEETSLPSIMADKGKDQMTSGVWKQALKAGDPLAVRLMDRSVEALGAAVAGVINLLDVQTIVFGGGLTEKLGMSHVDLIAQAARPRLMNPDAPRHWVLAELGDDAGVVGAAALVQD